MNGVQFIHWDYNELEGNLEADSSLQLLSGAVKNNETDEKKGIYFRWVLRCFVGSQLALSCIAEAQYIGDISMLSETQLIKMSQHSFEQFKTELSERLPQTNLTISLDFELSYQEASSILQQLSEQ